MDFDFEDLDGDDRGKVRDFNAKFIEALSTDAVKAEVAKLRESSLNSAHFERERAKRLGPFLDPLYEEHQVTLEWIENQNWVLREDDEEIAEQFKSIDALFAFGVLGPLELQRGECVQASGLEGESEAPFNSRVGVMLGFVEDSGRYTVRFFPEDVAGLRPENLRKIDHQERLQHIQELLLQQLCSPDGQAELAALRAASAKREEFEEARWAKVGPVLEPVCKHHGVELSWVLESVETLSGTSAQIAERRRQIDAAMSYALGPLELERGDCVEISELDAEDQKQLNGKKALVWAWFEESCCYEVHVVGGQHAYLRPGSLAKLDTLEKVRAVQHHIMDVLSSPMAQGALDMLRAKCANMVQYAKKLPDTLRQVSAPTFEAFGVEEKWYSDVLESHPKDRELRSVAKRIETLTAFGKIGPWGLEKGAFYEAYGLSDREKKDMNGTAVLILSWDDAKGCYDVSPVGSPSGILSLPAENLRPIVDKTFASKDEAAAFQKELREVLDASATKEKLASLSSCKPDVREYLTALQSTLLELQKPLLKKFGFREDFVGQNHMQRAMARYEADPDFAQRTIELERFGLRELRFDGKVALVTGAGRGLGRAYAMLLAARGAKVVVNNRTPQKADEVVAEITARGGTAVAEYSNIATAADNIMPFVLDKFGRIDIVVANAGLLDDHRFEIMKTEYFTNVIDTHVFGHYKVLKAAWPHLVQQKYGRVVIIASESGLHGNWGQSNYGAAKLALTSMGQTLAIEGFKDGVLTNVVCPVGLTRMTNDLRPVPFRAPESELASALQPSDKTVAYLCHETCKTTAGIFRAEEGHIQSFRWQADDAFVAFESTHANALEAIAAQWTEWAKWEHTSYPGLDLHVSYQPGGKAPSEPGFAGSKLEKGKSQDKLRFDNRVAIVTAGGRGLGRLCCLFLAARGAKVLVNDSDSVKADKVVAEIKAQNGEAVAEYSDVAKAGEALVDAAMNHWDRVDVVVAHAYQREDASFANSTFEQFSSAMNMDLIGHVKLLQAAWPQMFMGRFGRIVLITSDSGLHGGTGQISHGAAKGSLIALGQTLAMEGYKYGILTNAISAAPDSLSDQELEQKPPSAVAPIGYLCHESCKASAGIFRASNGKVSSLRWQSDEAFVDFDPESGDGALETVAAQWSDVARWGKVSYPGLLIHKSYR